jgi:hypothetical protein
MIESYLEGFQPLVESFLLSNEKLAFLLVDKTGTIVSNNKCFDDFINTEGCLAGTAIDSLLDSGWNRDAMQKIANAGMPTWLHFKRKGTAPLLLSCRIGFDDEGNCLILGTFKDTTDSSVLTKMTVLSNELTNMARELRRKNRELQEANAKIKTLRGIIPICMYCKKIRDDAGLWNRLEKYISENSEALFSHCICDDCLKERYPEVDLDDE